MIVDHYQTMVVGDDNGNLSKIHFQKFTDKTNNQKPKANINTNPLRDYENIKEKRIELKGIDKLKNQSFD